MWRSLVRIQVRPVFFIEVLAKTQWNRAFRGCKRWCGYPSNKNIWRERCTTQRNTLQNFISIPMVRNRSTPAIWVRPRTLKFRWPASFLVEDWLADCQMRQQSHCTIESCKMQGSRLCLFLNHHHARSSRHPRASAVANDCIQRVSR